MRDFLQEIKARIKEECGSVKTVAIWNNQVDWILNGNSHLWRSTAVFIEVQAPASIMTLGDGVQLYDPFDVVIHIVSWKLNATEGDLDENLSVFDIENEVYKVLHKRKATKSGTFVRLTLSVDSNHFGLYHMTAVYRSTLVDDSWKLANEGEEMNAPVSGEISLTKDGSDDDTAPHIYEVPQPEDSEDEQIIFPIT